VEIFSENYDNSMLRNVGIRVSRLAYNLEHTVTDMFANREAIPVSNASTAEHESGDTKLTALVDE
jgi:hypothetical protein